MEEITIALSKRKITLVILGSGVFVILGFLLMLAMWDTVAVIFPIVGIAFFGACGIYGCMKFFDNKPGSVINNDGIIIIQVL